MAIPMTQRICDIGKARMTIIRAARLRDMAACADIINAWIDATAWMPRIHSRRAVADYYRDIVFTTLEVFVAETDERIVGLIALSPDNSVSALYVHHDFRGKAIGKALLDHAKQKSTGPIQLWTFAANRGAQAFYLRERFREIRRTDGDNEEKLPDILYRFEPDDAGSRP
jgi:GNAT superfamily N-acetyltransferase